MGEPVNVLERFSLVGKVALVTGASSGLGAGFAVALAQAAARLMPRGSAIVNIASVLGLVKSYFPQAAYAASKAGLIGLTRDLNQQWSERRGIRVNAVAPGYFRSEMTEAVPPGSLQDFIARTSTLGRMGEQHELDAAVVFLVSPASSYIAGVTLAVDGGMSGH